MLLLLLAPTSLGRIIPLINIGIIATSIVAVKNIAIVRKMMKHVIKKGVKNHLHHHVLYFGPRHFCPSTNSKLGVELGSSFLIPSFSCGYQSRVCFYIP